MNLILTLAKKLTWLVATLLALTVLAALLLSLLGWNWLRAPIERLTLEKTGRALVIAGDLRIQLRWPAPRLEAQAVRFANPAWAEQPDILTADAVALSLHLPSLLTQNLVISDLHLVHPLVFLQRAADGRKTWLLDRQQQDDNARLKIDRLSLDQGVIGYEDRALQTSVRADLSSAPLVDGSTTRPGIRFNAQGQYKGLPFKAQGSGEPVLTLIDAARPYGLKVDATVGDTHIQADGQITDLLKFTAIDMQLVLQGKNLNQLFTLTGIATPASRDYATQGHLVRRGNTLRYDDFAGRVGSSDISGWLQLDSGGQRPALKGKLVSKQLALQDLGPVIGARPGKLQAAKKAVARSASVPAITPSAKRVIPDLPFHFEHWDSVDAELDFSARSIRQSASMPLLALSTHLSLKDSVLRLDPLQFGLARGQINAVISLDGRQDPIAARAQVQVNHLALAPWLGKSQQGQASVSQIDGEISLIGHGNSVGHMLANANGSVALLMSGGEISQMVMEKAGLHLWEMLRLKLTGDKTIRLRCAVADFDVKTGTLHANTLLLDTQVTTLVGQGSISLAQEKFDLTFNQKTKNTSPLALRSPIHVGGNFVKPIVQVDKARMTVRALGALVLGSINPLLMLLPLIDPGPGKDSDCGPWLRGQK